MLGNILLGSGLYGIGGVSSVPTYSLMAAMTLLETFDIEGVALISILEKSLGEQLALTSLFEGGSKTEQFAIYTGLEDEKNTSLAFSTELNYEKISERIALLSNLQRTHLANLATKTILEVLKRNGIATVTSLETGKQISIGINTLIENISNSPLAVKTIAEAIKAKTLSLGLTAERESFDNFALRSLIEKISNNSFSTDTTIEAMKGEILATGATTERENYNSVALDSLFESIKTGKISLESLLERYLYSSIAITTTLQYEKMAQVAAIIALLEQISLTNLSINAMLEAGKIISLSVEATLERSGIKVFAIDVLLEKGLVSNISINTILETPGILGHFAIQGMPRDFNIRQI